MAASDPQDGTSPHMSSVTASPGPASIFFASQRLKLHYVDWGNPEAPPLLMIHGGRDHCRNWDALAQRLRADWHVLAVDLRGHGDSQWASDGNYDMAAYVYDLAQWMHRLDLGPVSVVSHSLGGSIATRYAGIEPGAFKQLVAIEGLGLSPRMTRERSAKPAGEKMRSWIERSREQSAWLPRRYPTIDVAINRMREEHTRLTDTQVRHLATYGATQNEDGTWRWKFDPYLNTWPPYDWPQADIEELWRAIACPLLCIYGKESQASDPLTDGRAQHFSTAEFVRVDGASHWVHHDRLDEVEALCRRFLKR